MGKVLLSDLQMLLGVGGTEVHLLGGPGSVASLGLWVEAVMRMRTGASRKQGLACVGVSIRREGSGC